jgi:uncharacterized membrane protein YphA (DoxX/SURF4 family)
VNLLLWIAQGVLALAYVTAGMMKTTRTKADLQPRIRWVEDFSQLTVRIIGFAELLGAVGLILPGVFGVAEILTPIAATALGFMMLLAVFVHIRRKEPQGVVVVAILLALNAFVAWGRFGPEPL